MREINIRLNANRAKAVHTGIKIASGDKGIVFKIAVDELNTEGTVAKIVFKRSNGTSVEAGITEEEGVYSYKTLGNEFAVVGQVVADVKLYKEEERVSTCTFVFDVTADTMDGLGTGAAGYSDTLERIKTGMEETEQEMNALTDELQELYEDYTAAFGNVAPFNPRGPYSEEEVYEVRDLVTHDNASWVCYKNCTGATPGEDSDCWQKLVSEGSGGGPAQGGDADTLGGHDAEYFATAESVADITDGTTKVGDAKKLDGHDAEYFAENDRVKKIQTVSGATLSSVGWYRVAEYLTNGAENISTGSLANSVMLFIKRNRQNNDNEQHLLLLESISGKQSFVSLSSKSNIQIITKARYTYNLEESKVYLEIYYNGTVANFCNFEISHTDRDKVGTSGNRYWWYAITPTLTEETVEGVTVTTTYDIPANATPLTTGNKPTGTYSGTGEATERIVYISGIGGTLRVANSSFGMALVTKDGACCITKTGFLIISKDECKYENGKLTIKTTSNIVNAGGYGYAYELL